MKPHPRIRKTIKWTSAAATVLLVVVWIGSGWLGVVLSLSSDTIELGADRGFLRILVEGICSDSRWTFPKERPTNMLQPGKMGVGERGIRSGTHSMMFEHRFVLTGYMNAMQVELPLWLLAGMCGAATAIAWRLDILARRRAKLNLCPTCNYDRTGLPIGAACPECGHGSAA